MMDQPIPIQHGVDRADGGQLWAIELLPQRLANFGRTPAGILPPGSSRETVRGLDRIEASSAADTWP